jgi:L-threonylcarbamoyladenylate synthase
MTELLATDAAGLARAAALLRAGALVAFGTETVYGLGGRAADGEAVARIYAAKGRPRFNPLICHYTSAEAAFRDVEPSDAARTLAARFWPGPLTLVLPRRADCPVSLLAGAGLATLAVRVPAAPAAHTLLGLVGEAIAAPSANRSGAVSPTRAEHVLAELGGRIAAVLDTGPCEVGVESTVLDLAGPPTLLRHGGITREAIEAVIGPIAETAAVTTAPRSPGQLASHYAPTLPVRLQATFVRPDEALLAFGPALAGAGAVFQLSERRDLVQAAARLFEGLRALDAQGIARGLAGIAAMPIPATGLGAAINDRLARAAAPRAPAPGPVAQG